MRLLFPSWVFLLLGYIVQGQQGQNYYVSSSDSGFPQSSNLGGRYIQYQANGQPEFSDYFPPTNGGPLFPFRPTAVDDGSYHQVQDTRSSGEFLADGRLQRQSQQQPFVPRPPTYQLPPRVDQQQHGYEAPLSSAGFVVKHGSYQSPGRSQFTDIRPTTVSYSSHQQRFRPEDRVVQRPTNYNRQNVNNGNRYQPETAAFSQITDSRNAQNLKVQHSGVQSAEMAPHYWNQQEELNSEYYRARNAPRFDSSYSSSDSRPNDHFSSGVDASTEESLVKNSRFFVKQPTISQHFDVAGSIPSIPQAAETISSNEQYDDDSETDINKQKNSYLQPTTYSPSSKSYVASDAPVKLSTNRVVSKAVSSTAKPITTIRPPITSSSSPDDSSTRRRVVVPKSSSNRGEKSKTKVQTVNTTIAPVTTLRARTESSTANSGSRKSSHKSNIVTLHQDYSLSSEDNSRESTTIDTTTVLSTSVVTRPKNIQVTTTTVSPSSTKKSGNDKKKGGETAVNRNSDYSRGLKKQGQKEGQTEGASSTTEGWLVVASVQTSRSVSGPVKSIPKSNAASSPESNTTTEQEEEDIIDKLDQVQSELSSQILHGGFPSHDKLTMNAVPDSVASANSASGTRTPTSSSTRTLEQQSTTEKISSEDDDTEESEQTFTRKFVPSNKRTTTKPKTDRKSLLQNIQFDELTNLLPPGFKARGFTPKDARTTKMPENATTSTTTTEKPSSKDSSKNKNSSSLLSKYKIKFDDISSFLPSDYKPQSTSENPSTEKLNEDSTSTEKRTSINDILGKAKPADISAFLPPGYELSSSTVPTTDKSKIPLDKQIRFQETNQLVPRDYVLSSTPESENRSINVANNSIDTEVVTKTSDSKVVFPSRPGVGKKPQAQTKPSTSKPGLLPHQVPVIQKGWPTRATTEFHGWSTVSASPISVEKLLKAAREASAKENESSSTVASESSTITTTTTTTTTTEKPTTPGICMRDCELAGSLKLVGGVSWLPELLDHNTKEWKNLANDVRHQLETIFQSSEALNRWYRRITIDAFSPGSVIVDYFVELSDLGRTVNTADMKRLFKETLVQEAVSNGDVAALTTNGQKKQLKFGKFTVDPTYVDFVVVPKAVNPTMAMSEQDMWLPQWAVAVIVIGMASLLFVVIFGITVFVNKRKNALKHPVALTEDMLHELNKNHMSNSFDNYGVDDLYNMEDVWNEKPVKKKTSHYHDGSMPNIYDSWKSDWNGYYSGSNHYYIGKTRSEYGRRRLDYDPNF